MANLKNIAHETNDEMMHKKTLLATLLLLFLISILMLLGGNEKQQIGIVGEIHYHADFKVILEGAEFDFAKPAYMSDNQSLSKFAHLHDLNGEILHVHAKGVTLRMFFKSLGMELTNDCLTLDDGNKLCSDEPIKSLKLFVNGNRILPIQDYMPSDLDRILITYGSEPESLLKSQIESVKNNACIYSEKCPERGAPPIEAGCVGESNCIA